MDIEKIKWFVIGLLVVALVYVYYQNPRNNAQIQPPSVNSQKQ